LIGELFQKQSGADGERRNRALDDMSTNADAGAAVNGSLKAASLERLVCLQRQWIWTDEAMARFDSRTARPVLHLAPVST
jgi:hypothetical protein